MLQYFWQHTVEALRMISCQTLFVSFPSIMVVRLPHSSIW